MESLKKTYSRFGNYEVMEKLYKYIPEARQGKAHVDHIIDLCGTPKEGGTGLQNLRECIVWTEEKFNFEPKLKKVNYFERNMNTTIFLIFSLSGNKCQRTSLSAIATSSCSPHISEKGLQGNISGIIKTY